MTQMDRTISIVTLIFVCALMVGMGVEIKKIQSTQNQILEMQEKTFSLVKGIASDTKVIRQSIKDTLYSPQRTALSPHLPVGKSTQMVDVGSPEGIKQATEALTPNNFGKRLR